MVTVLNSLGLCVVIPVIFDYKQTILYGGWEVFWEIYSVVQIAQLFFAIKTAVQTQCVNSF